MISLDTAPSYARPHFQEYQDTGKLAALDSTMELSPAGVDAFESSLTAQMRQARAWDESDRDELSGQPGAVRVLDPKGPEWGGLVEATFSGDETEGELLYRDSVPNYTGGFEAVTLTRFTPEAIENVGISGSISGEVTNPNLVHLERADQTGYVLYQSR